MKQIKSTITMLSLASLLALSGCSSTDNSENGSEGSGSKSQTTPNDSSGAESTKAIGIGEDNQNESNGYPANQSNLNADSTRLKHDSIPAATAPSGQKKAGESN